MNKLRPKTTTDIQINKKTCSSGLCKQKNTESSTYGKLITLVQLISSLLLIVIVFHDRIIYLSTKTICIIFTENYNNEETNFSLYVQNLLKKIKKKWRNKNSLVTPQW